MGSEKRIRLIVNADDFGISHSANRAIIKAHQEGILTTTSLMVNGNAASDAVRKAYENPDLGVGLHITLVKGRSTLKPSEIIGVVNQRFEFEENPFRAGVRYFFARSLKPYLRQEVNAQFAEFRITKLPLDHVNGHLHFHLHPTIFSILKRDYRDWNIRAMRLTRDPLLTNLRLSFGNYFYKFSHALFFNRLCASAGPALKRRGIKHTDQVFGLLEDGRITEDYLLKVIDNLFPGDFEIYAHPDEDQHAHELAALCSPKVKQRIQERGIELIRYADL